MCLAQWQISWAPHPIGPAMFRAMDHDALSLYVFYYLLASLIKETVFWLKLRERVPIFGLVFNRAGSDETKY